MAGSQRSCPRSGRAGKDKLEAVCIAYGSAVETGELLEIAIDARIVATEVGTYLLKRNTGSQRLLLGMLRRRKSR
jgi:hypothetical protein